jgi:predicted secreted protein
MNRIKSTVVVLVILSLILTAFSLTLVWGVENSSELWSKTFGGDGMDACTSMLQTADEGFALFGYAHSFEAASDWLVKTDEHGNMEWNKTIGGGVSFIQTSDGGFAFVGTNASSIEGYIPVGIMPEGFWSHVWLAKTDEYGNIEWTQTYDEKTGYYHGSSVIQTTDGGFALAGSSFSYFGEYSDLVLIKTDSMGNNEWSRSYGGSDEEFDPYGLVQTSDGGFALAAKTYSYGEGYVDIWLIKIDETGNTEWSRTYGGERMDYPTSLIQLSDGSFVLAGCADSFGARGYDFWLIKTDNQGNMLWNQTYGTEYQDTNPSLVQTLDGGFALAGFTWADPEAYFLLIKTDNRGNMLWNQTYSGGAVIGLPTLIQTLDGGFALSGGKGSFGTGDYDFWLIKTDAQGIPEFPSWTVLLAGFFAVTILSIFYKHQFNQRKRK